MGQSCEEISGATASTFTPTSLDATHAIDVRVTATDTEGTASTLAGPTQPIDGEGDPQLLGAPEITGVPQEGNTLTVTDGSWEAGGTISHSYQWERCNEANQECGPISGAITASYDLEEGDLHHTIRVLVTASSGGAESIATSVSTPAITRAVIDNTAPPSISGPTAEALQAGQVLKASEGLWSGLGSITYSYQWLRCDNVAQHCESIEGANSSEYRISVADEGSRIRVSVTGTTGAARVSAASDATVAVTTPSGALLPQPGAEPRISGAGVVGEILTLDPGTWESLTPVSFTFQWYDCTETSEEETCTAISGATSATYAVTTGDLGSRLTAVVTATNTASETATSQTWLAVGAPEARGGVEILGETHPGNQLSAREGYSGGTNPITASYQWEKCNSGGTECTVIPGMTGTEYEVASADISSTIRVAVTYTNLYGSATAWSSVSEAITHAEPRLVYSPGFTYHGSFLPGTVLTAEPGYWEGDKPMTFEYTWKRCYSESECTVVGTGETYELTEADEENFIVIELTGTNDVGTSTGSRGGTYYFVSPWYHEVSSLIAPVESGVAQVGQTLTTTDGTWWGNATSFEYEWFSCPQGGGCTPISGAHAASYTVQFSDIGRRIEAMVKATNRWSYYEEVWTERSEPVVDHLPLNTTPPSISGEAVAGNTLTVEGSGVWHTEARTGEASFSYQWQTCNAEGLACTAIPGATAATYTTTGNQHGQKIAVAVTLTNSGGSVTASAPAVLLATASTPTNTTSPAITGTTQAGRVLTASHGVWSGSPTIRYGFRWERCNTEGLGCTELTSSTAAEYKTTPADVGHTLRAIVAASNGAGSVTATSAATATITAAGAPTNVTAPTIAAFDKPSIGAPYHANPGTWTGGPSLAEQWQRCSTTEPSTCTTIEHTAGLTYTPSQGDAGYYLRLLETATNSAGSATSTSSISTEPVALPSIATLTASYTGAPTVGSTLIAANNLTASLELPVSVEYTFARLASSGGPTELQSGTSPSYALTDSDVGHELSITATTTVWRADHATELNTQTATIQTPIVRRLLTPTTPPTLSGSYSAGATLTATTGTWPGTGLAYEYSWQTCDTNGEHCETIDDQHGASYRTRTADIGKTIRVSVTASDQDDAGSVSTAPSEPITSPAALTNNTPPSLSGTPEDSETLTATTGEWTGTGPITYSYQWVVCRSEAPCAEAAGATESHFELTEDDIGATIQVTVTASSEAGEALATSAASATVTAAPAPENRVPPGLDLLGPSTSAAIVTADGGEWNNVDAKGLSGELSYQWQRCDSTAANCQDIEKATESSYDLSTADIGHRVRARIIAVTHTGQASAYTPLTPLVQTSAGSASGRIVYANGSALYTAAPDGSSVTELTNCASLGLGYEEGECSFFHPEISPSGQMVAVEIRPKNDLATCATDNICPGEDTAPDARIIAMNYDGSDPHTVLTGASQPNWTPDSTKLAVTRTVTEGTALYTVAPDGTQLSPLTESTPNAQSASYSPDGTTLAYVAKAEPTSSTGLYIANSDGSDPTPLNLSGLKDIDSPAISGSGSKLVFTAIPAADYHAGVPIRSLYTVNTDGTELRRQGSSSADYSSPAFGPEGNSVVATRRTVTSHEGHTSIESTEREITENHTTHTSEEASLTVETGNGGNGDISFPPTTVFGHDGPGGPTAEASGATADAVARKFAPVMLVDGDDGFSPISANWMLKLTDGYNPTILCFGGTCNNPARFPLLSGEGIDERLMYPGEPNEGSQEEIINSTLARYHRTQKTSPEVYYFEGEPNSSGEVELEYWYYYTFNYFSNHYGQKCLGCGGLTHDLHEGDLEHITVTVRPGNDGRLIDGKATKYYLAKHKTGVTYAPSSPEIHVVNGHILGYAARGDHATYNTCYRHGIYVPGAPHFAGIGIRDYTCDSRTVLEVSPSIPHTALGNLGSWTLRQRFACWQGLLGGQEGGDEVWGSSPKAPLRQSKARGAAEACGSLE